MEHNMSQNEFALDIRGLSVEYRTDEGTVKALNGLNLSIKKGTSLGLVGETGAGKTTTGLSILKLIPDPPGKIVNGSIELFGSDLMEKSDKQMRKIRGKEVSMIFQDPMTSLDPIRTVEDQIAEAIRKHENLKRADAVKKARDVLELVGIPAHRGKEYPHQFSGGMKQRVVIAIALSCNPQLLIADEPTTALDVTIQAQILEMIRDLRERFRTSMLLITHDLGVIAQNCDYVSVIYAGEIVETGTVHDIFRHKLHPYTEGLFSSIPNINEDVERLVPIEGLMPDPTNLPAGCAFCDRCRFATEQCKTEHPHLVNMGGEEGSHQVRCLRYKETREEGE